MLHAAGHLAVRGEEPLRAGPDPRPGLRARVARLSPAYDARWLWLLVGARLAATAIALVLVAWQRGADWLEIAGIAYGGASTAALAIAPSWRRNPAVWAADFAIASLLIVGSPDWRSPFYLFWLTALAIPAVALPLARAVAVAFLAPLAFLAIAFAGGPAPGRLGPVSSETLAIHLSLPFLLVCALAYAADALRRLQDERSRRERLAIESERRRIAWELHDSAKQRLHAAHLMVSSLRGRTPEELRFTIERAIVELESAASDMDTSLAELRSPLEGRPLDEALRDRAAELSASAGARVRVVGVAPPLPPLVAAHAYRIGCEALTNALRHADAGSITVTLATRERGFVLTIRDDGHGLATARLRSGGNGLVAMEGRAESIGGRLQITTPGDGLGTEVVLDVPLDAHGATR